MFIQRKELVEQIVASRDALASHSIGFSPLSTESTTVDDDQGKNLVGTPRQFHEILDHHLNSKVQLEYLLDWGSEFEATWTYQYDVPEEATSRYFESMRTAVLDWY